MKILSLFDGISCGQLALKKANIPIEKYFASEIDEKAIKVTQYNHPDTIQLGDVKRISAKELPQIDLLIGGSPCQSFSMSGKQLGFDDDRGQLFFEYVRLLREIKPKYFLLENVKMKQEYRGVITSELEVEPIEINSNLVSAQNRKRLYWTNIPLITQPKDKGLLIKDILSKVPFELFKDERLDKTKVKTKNFYQCDKTGKGHKSQDARIYFLNGKMCTLSASGGRYKTIVETENEKVYRKLSPIEWERLQTLPENYTNVVSDPQRYDLIGNGWTIDIIAHIFSLIPKDIKDTM